MFTTHYKMTDLPFQEDPSTNAIYQDERVQQGMARLDFLAQQGNIMLVTGDEGTGKTALIRLFSHSLENQTFLPIYVHLTHLSAVSFLRVLVSGFGEIPGQYKDRLLVQLIDKVNRQKKTIFLFIDNAHLLSNETLTDIQLLVSSRFEQPLKLVLCGHGDIKKRLQQSDHISLSQRINLFYNLATMTESQTSEYIDFQLRRVDACDKIFSADVKKELHGYTKGIPRLINNLATHCLINTAIQKAQKVTVDIFRQTISETPIHS